MKATSESSSNLGSPISMRDVLIRVWDQGYQSPHFRRSRFRPDGITFRITIACRQFPYSAAFTTNINWKKSRLEKFRMSYLRSTTDWVCIWTFIPAALEKRQDPVEVLESAMATCGRIDRR